MSAALLRRGLELLGASEAPQAAPSQAKPSGARVKRARKAKATQARKLRNSAKGKVPKSALAEFQKRECQDHLKTNLKFMTCARSTVAEAVTQQVGQGMGRGKGPEGPWLRLSPSRLARWIVAEAVTQQILLQNQGRKACDRPVAKTKKKKVEGTVFTEEDFQKFQQEYFGS
ncbi:active regulator of SIRT1 isoform X1 [Loxodonta africana]|uniref:active regulator of SIRT1 isoform X1 n=1 Tax=Loxodonta africana TaxID=9785 RepID=UPI0030CCA40A